MMRYVSETDDRDFVDRLHSYFTTNLLIGLSILISFKVILKFLKLFLIYFFSNLGGSRLNVSFQIFFLVLGNRFLNNLKEHFMFKF